MLPLVQTPSLTARFPRPRGATTSLALGAVLMAACGARSREPVRTVMAPVDPGPTELVEAVPLDVGHWYEQRSAWQEAILVREPRIAWQARLPGPVIHPLRADGTLVYAISAGQLFSLRADGTTSWSARIQASGAVGLTEEGVVVGTEEGPVALYDVERGSIVRQYPGFGPVRGAPMPIDGDLAWVTVHGMVGGLWA